MKALHDLLSALSPEHVIAVSQDAAIAAPVCESTDAILPGGLFVARRGKSVDGHDFIPQAIERGAAAIVGERDIDDLSVPYVQVRDSQYALGWLAAAYHDFPSRKLVIVGVTGTDGKTTTSTLIHSILNIQTAGKAGLISTIAAHIGGATADTGLHVTTPSAPQVQALLARMVENGLTHAVLEMTSHGLSQGRLNGVDVDVAVLTNVTHEHLDYHGSFEAYRAAKAIMFEMLMKSYRKPNRPKVSVINADDQSADYFAAIPADFVLKYGSRQSATHRIGDIHYTAHGTEFSIMTEDRFKESYTTRLVAQFNVMNATAAVVTTGSLGVLPRAIQEGLNAVRAVSGRMERIDEGQNFTAIVDFAHTPNALKSVLETCRQMLPDGGRLITVFGSAGLRDVEKRRLMAETSARLADFTILTAEDPRTESLDAILQMMADGCVSQGGVEGQTFIRVHDRGEALYRACQLAKKSDIVAACGKGHEQSMCFGTIEYPWDDRDAMRAALRGTPLTTLPTARQEHQE